MASSVGVAVEQGKPAIYRAGIDVPILCLRIAAVREMTGEDAVTASGADDDLGQHLPSRLSQQVSCALPVRL